MKTSELKQIIKEACKEAFREEMKEILLEAIKSPKTIVQETKNNTSKQYNQNLARKAYSEIIGGVDHLIESSPQTRLGPIPSNTAGEGTSLPEGEVGLDLIMRFTNPNG